jgi:hypothetical protein
MFLFQLLLASGNFQWFTYFYLGKTCHHLCIGLNFCAWCSDQGHHRDIEWGSEVRVLQFVNVCCYVVFKNIIYLPSLVTRRATAMKYVFKGMGLGNNCASLLKWHASLVTAFSLSFSLVLNDREYNRTPNPDTGWSWREGHHCQSSSWS